MTGTYLAPAKINLGLEVRYKRADGYHELNTLFCRVADPHDSITVTPAGSFQITSNETSLSEENIVRRAAEAYCSSRHVELPPLHLHLDKRIPIGAGLGGGSSDAAAMLGILKDWFHASADGSLAAKLGADVPFFVSGWELAHATGIGDELTRIDAKLNAAVLIVVHPEFRVSTKEAYEALTPEPSVQVMDYKGLFRGALPLDAWRDAIRNDFEPEIFRQYPALAKIKHTLYARGAGFALMSGSGSAIYGIFEDNSHALEAKLAFEKEGNQVFLTTDSSTISNLKQ